MMRESGLLLESSSSVEPFQALRKLGITKRHRLLEVLVRNSLRHLTCLKVGKKGKQRKPFNHKISRRRNLIMSLTDHRNGFHERNTDDLVLRHPNHVRRRRRRRLQKRINSLDTLQRWLHHNESATHTHTTLTKASTFRKKWKNSQRTKIRSQAHGRPPR